MTPEQSRILNLVQEHFPMLAEKELQNQLALNGKIYEFQSGETIMDFGSYIRIVPLLIKGSIKVVREDKDDAKEIFLYYIHAGETCSSSFSCCMMNKKSDIRTVAEEDTLLIGVPVRYIDEWMMKYQSWKNFVMRSFDKRITELIETIDTIAFHKMDERLLNYLQKKSTATKSQIIKATHQEIAYDLNASREAVSRLLKTLEKNNQIKLGRNKIELL